MAAAGWIVPWWTPLAAQLVAGAAAFAWLRRCGLGGFLLASALALFASFLLGRQAFLNYYAFVSALLLLAALVFASPSTDVPSGTEIWERTASHRDTEERRTRRDRRFDGVAKRRT